MKDIVAFVGVRSGSVRVKNKNVKPFGNTTLLDLKLDTLKHVDGIRGIIVSSDCDDMLEKASKHGVILHKRDDYHSSGKCTNSEYFRRIGEIVDADNVMYSPVTSPFVSLETYAECIRRFDTCNNIVTTNLVKHHLWLDGNPINYDIENAPNSQDLPDIHAINYGCCLISRKELIETKNVVSSNPTFYVLDEIESIDIDTNLDYTLAESLYGKLNG